MIGRPFLFAAAIAALAETAKAAEAFVPEGSCAVIVASRKTMAEVDEFVRSHPQISFGPVFSSRNGWYAISAGMADEAAADEHLSRLTAEGIIPPDSYCSEGESYTAIARASADLAAAGGAEKPVQYGLYGEFDARPISIEEKRFLQAALALEGYYKGLLDGVWGRGRASRGGCTRTTSTHSQKWRALVADLRKNPFILKDLASMSGGGDGTPVEPSLGSGSNF